MPLHEAPRSGEYATDGTRLVYVLTERAAGAKRELLVEDASAPVAEAEPEWVDATGFMPLDAWARRAARAAA